MLELLHTIVMTPAFKGALSGFVAAIAVDGQAFKSWKSFHDAAEYDWGVASFRWLQGIVIGALVGSGYGWLVN